MPIKVKTLKGNTTISWTNEDQTTAASWTIKQGATEAEAWETLTKATVFIGKQIGTMGEPTTPTATAPRATASGSSQSATTPALQLPTMSPMSLSDKPSDGGPPTGSMDSKFWETMPTAEVPGHLAGDWQMDPGRGWDG